MKKPARILGALFCATALILQMACSATGPNTVVAKVDGENIYRWELDKLYRENISQYNSTAAGINGQETNIEDPKNSEERMKFRKDLLNTLINELAIVQYGKKNGYDLTDAEKTEVDSAYDELVAKNIAYYEENDFKGDADAHKKAEEKWQQSLKDNNMTEAFLKTSMYNQKIHEKVTEDLYKDLSVSDEIIQETYEQMVEDQKENYTNNPAAYAEDARIPSGNIVYNPPGFIRVKQILIEIPEELNEQIIALDTELAELLLVMEQKGGSTATTDDLGKQRDDLEKKVDDLYIEAYNEIRPEAEEVLTKVKAGEDFDALIEEYGDDPSMLEYPMKDYGYLIGESSTDVLVPMRDAAVALKSVGETSELVQTTNGYHILKVVEKVEPGPVELNDQIREFISKLLLVEPRYEVLNEFGSQVRAEADIQIYESRI